MSLTENISHTQDDTPISGENLRDNTEESGTYNDNSRGSTVGPREVPSIIPLFDPDDATTEEATDWLDDVDAAKEMYSWEDHRSVLYAAMQLRGAAKIWYNGARRYLKTWQDFKKEMEINFPPRRNLAQIHELLKSKRKKEDESIATYFHTVKTLARKINLDDATTKVYLINGLPCVSSRNTLSSQRFSSLTELLIAMQDMETAKLQQLSTSSSEKRPEHKHGSYHRKNFRPYGHQGRQSHSENRQINEEKQKSSVTTGEFGNQRSYNSSAHNGKRNERRNGPKSRFLVDKLGIKWYTNVQAIKGYGESMFYTKEVSIAHIEIDDVERVIKLHIVDDNLQNIDILMEFKTIDSFSFFIHKITKKREISDSEIFIGPIAEISKRNLIELIKKYRECFAADPIELSHTTMEEMNIEINSKDIVRYSPYGTPYAYRTEMRDKIRELLKNGIIEMFTSDFASPMIVIRKKNRDLGVVSSIGELNRKKKEYYPMTNIEEEFNALCGRRIFSTLDLYLGYHHIGINEKSRRYSLYSYFHGGRNASVP
uniref:Retrotransposon gag domain-containing protein n=1 Tax=Phlebotomus papatasi TaxID=29031 RepID=A0A1B0DPT0_PHLPP